MLSGFGANDSALGELDGYQSSARNYPRFWAFHNNLGMIYIDMGRYEEGLKEGIEGARLQANAEPPYRRQLDAYLCTYRSWSVPKLRSTRPLA